MFLTISLKLLLVLIILFVNFYSQIAWTKDYFVRPDGVSYGNSSGLSYENAWSGFRGIKWGARALYNGLQPGDTLHVCGTHFETLFVKGSGLFGKGQRITITGDCVDPGKIDCKGVMPSAIDTEDRKNLNIDSLIVENTKQNAINLINKHLNGKEPGYISIVNCTIRKAGFNGINFRGTHIKIDHCIIEDIQVDGIYGRGENAVITNNVVRNVSLMDGGDGGDCVQLSTNVRNFYVAHNIFDHSNDDRKQGFVAHSDLDKGGIFEYNQVVGKAAENHYVVQVRVEDAILRHNYLEGGKYTLGIMRGAKVYNNIIKNGYLVGIRVGVNSPTSDTFSIFNNIIYNTHSGVYHNGPATVIMKNNIIMKCENSAFNISGPAIPVTFEDYNCLFNNGTDYKYTKIIKGINTIRKDPEFIDAENNQFDLRNGSPCISTGTAIGQEISPIDDLEVKREYLKPNIGLYKLLQPVLLKQS